MIHHEGPSLNYVCHIFYWRVCIDRTAVGGPSQNTRSEDVMLKNIEKKIAPFAADDELEVGILVVLLRHGHTQDSLLGYSLMELQELERQTKPQVAHFLTQLLRNTTRHTAGAV